MSLEQLPTIKGPGEGRVIGVVRDVYRFLVLGEDTNGAYATREAIVPPGGGPPRHLHTREQESFYVLEGEITFQVGEERSVAKPGTFVNMPTGVVHAFKNETVSQARMIISVAPAGLEKMFFEVGQPVEPGTTRAPQPTKQDIEQLVSIAPQYGVEIRVPQH